MAILKFKDPDSKEWKKLTIVSDGVTFIPSIDTEGNLSWTNTGHLVNPDTVNIYGKSFEEYAEKEDFPEIGSSKLLYIDLSTNKMYRWDEQTSIYVMVGGEGGSSDFHIKVVDSLPQRGAEKTIYYVPNPKGQDKNLYDEYMWVNNSWEKLGFAALDETKYYTKEEVDKKIQDSFDDYTPILKHTLKIGNDTFDGSEDVVIPIYEGEMTRIYPGL